MKPNDIKEIDDSFKRKPWKTLLYCVLAVIIFIFGAYYYGFFGEKGKQKATTRNSNSEGKPESPVHIKQQTKGDGSPAVVIWGDVVESKISIQGGVNVEISPESEERNKEELAVFPKHIEFYRNRKLSKCGIFLENRTDKTLYSIEFEALIDSLDERCEEITIDKKGESDKAFELDLQGESINYEVLKFKNEVKEDGRRVYHVRLARLGPKEIVPFVVTFESNCPPSTIVEKTLRIPITILDHSKVAPPTIGRNGNKIYFNVPTGSLSPHPDYETDKSKRIIRLEQEKLLELHKKAIVENRPMVIPLPLKDEDSGTYSMIKKIEGTRGKYLVAHAFKIQNIGVQIAKEVMGRFFESYCVSLTLGKPLDPETAKKAIEKAKPKKSIPLWRELQPGNYVTVSSSSTLHLHTGKDIAPEAMQYLYDALLYKWEITYKHRLKQKQVYKTTVTYQIKKDQYSIISIHDE